MGFHGLQHAHPFRTNLDIQTPKEVSITSASTKVVVFLKFIKILSWWLTSGITEFPNSPTCINHITVRFKVTTHPSSTSADQSALGEGKVAPGILPMAASSSSLSNLRRPNHRMWRSHKFGHGTSSHRYHRLAGSATPAVARTPDLPEFLQADTSATNCQQIIDIPI